FVGSRPLDCEVAMKNPLEYTVLEIDALLHSDPREPQILVDQHRALNNLVMYIRERQREAHNYQVAKVAEQIRTKESVPRKKVRSLDAELLDNLEVVELEPRQFFEQTEGGYGVNGNVADVKKYGDRPRQNHGADGGRKKGRNSGPQRNQCEVGGDSRNTGPDRKHTGRKSKTTSGGHSLETDTSNAVATASTTAAAHSAAAAATAADESAARVAAATEAA